jgi:hypothetical protein
MPIKEKERDYARWKKRRIRDVETSLRDPFGAGVSTYQTLGPGQID